jgi:hypothetical protein
MALAEWAPSWSLMSWQPERELRRLRGTHVIALIHRQETTSLLGHPPTVPCIPTPFWSHSPRSRPLTRRRWCTGGMRGRGNEP